MDEQAGLENRSPSRDRGFESHPLLHNVKSQKTESGATIPANGYRTGWDSNGGSEGGAPPSRGDRSTAKARGGLAPSGSPAVILWATSNSHPLRHSTKSYQTKGGATVPTNGRRTGWDSNGGSEGGAPPSWGDRRHATARGGWPPGGSTEVTSVRLRMPTPSAIASKAIRQRAKPRS